MSPETILNFWFDEAGPARWYKQSDHFDAEVRARFETAALDAFVKPSDWATSPEAMLALIIMLDQFPRNMYRGTSAAFAWDDKALSQSKKMITKGWDLKIAMARRAFVYMPFMHSESLDDQKRCIELADQRLDDSSTVHHAIEHHKLIARFGRFPHRNAILGRDNTAEETAFLNSGGYSP